MINTSICTEPVVHVALRELYEETGIRVQVADIRRLGKDTDHLMQQSSGGHADEHETSIIMAIDASVVRLDRAVADYGNTGALPKTVYYAPTVFRGDTHSGPDYSDARRARRSDARDGGEGSRHARRQRPRSRRRAEGTVPGGDER